MLIDRALGIPNTDIILGHFSSFYFLNISVSTCTHFSEKEQCPVTEHINMCEFQHLYHPLPLKIVPQICVLACPYNLLSSNLHGDSKVGTISVPTCHLTSYSIASCQRFTSCEGPQKKVREVFEISLPVKEREQRD